MFMFFTFFVCLSAFCVDPKSIVDPSVHEHENWQRVQKDIAVLTQDAISQKTKEQEAAQLRAVQEEPQQKITELELRIARLEVEDRRMEREELQEMKQSMTSCVEPKSIVDSTDIAVRSAGVQTVEILIPLEGGFYCFEQKKE